MQGNGLHFDRVTEADTGIYTCYLDNFVQPVVSYKFSLMVEGKRRQSVNFSVVCLFIVAQWLERRSLASGLSLIYG